jgi:hypothetical protein
MSAARTHPLRSSLRIHLPLIAAALLGACGRSGELADASKPATLRPEGAPEISTGLNALESGQSQPAPVASDAELGGQTGDLLALMEQAQRNSAVSVDGKPAAGSAPEASSLADSGAPPEANPGVSFTLPVEPDITVQLPETAFAVGVDESLLPAEPVESRAQRHERLVGELAAVINEEASDSVAPAPSLAQIAALRFLQLPPTRTVATNENPGGMLGDAGAPLPGTPARLNAPPDPLDAYLDSAALSPGERDMLDAWKDFVFQARTALLQFNDLSAMAGPAQDLADSLIAWKPLAIAEAKLCTKVDGYGVYNELRKFDGEHKFLVGRPARMIVYLEPVNFQRTSVSREGVWGHEVRLMQDLRLYHSAKDTDTLVWRKPDQQINDFSRNRRRDFFVVQVVELPANLGVGAYRLKAILTDASNGAVAETIIPIEIVADASALRK